MKIATTIDYAATPQEVFAVLSDAKFQEAKCAATAAIRHSASIKTVGDRTVITTERVLPSDDLPDFARSMVGDTLKVTETQDWGPASDDGSRQGTVEMGVTGAPISLKGTLALRPNGDGTVETLDSELKAKVPLVGGKIEKAAAHPIEEAIAIEHQTAVEWLKR
ncbi:DUF2505 domain-containing protein [Pedococcus sp.]|jgi:hypothetical protein|uniref:DUF2505 domain-containing protein n=1 Tax=Pedococcus sp. TaxID=2860345 RepID=UPI002E135739|nr:DUF2505 domain-containing protein [Pedococcus sp.]